MGRIYRAFNVERFVRIWGTAEITRENAQTAQLMDWRVALTEGFAARAQADCREEIRGFLLAYGEDWRRMCQKQQWKQSCGQGTGEISTETIATQKAPIEKDSLSQKIQLGMIGMEVVYTIYQQGYHNTL